MSDQKNERSAFHVDINAPCIEGGDNCSSVMTSPAISSVGYGRVRFNLPPNDQCHMMRISFFLVGVATLMPWNVMVTATDYWMYKFEDPSAMHYMDIPDKRKTDLQTEFMAYLAIASHVPFLLMLIVHAFLGQWMHQVYRTLIGLSIVIVTFITTTVYITVDTIEEQQTFLRVTLISVLVMSSFGSMVQESLVTTLSFFPPSFVHVYGLGQSVAGIFAVMVQIVVLSIVNDPKDAALIYFVTCTVVLGITLGMYGFVLRSNLFKYFYREPDSVLDLVDGIDHVPGVQVIPRLETESSLWNSFVLMKVQAITLFMTNFTTSCMFPALFVLVVPLNPGSNWFTGRMFIPICCFLVFQVSDLVGRWVTKPFAIAVTHSKYLLLLSVLRIGLIPLFMLCNLYPRSNIPVIFPDHGIFIGIILIAGVTNGYLNENATVNGPKYLTSDTKTKTGFLFVLMVGMGLSTGSIVSLLLVKIL